ncbi:WYL domain-containing protein [Mycoplasmatota bacterium WC44]
MKKIERLQNIIYLLSQNKLSANNLAEALEVSPRTIYRDIDALSQMKVPIIAFEGTGGGYELEPSYFFKTVKLTDTELMMMILLLEIGCYLNTTDFDESVITLKHKLLNAAGNQLNISKTSKHITIEIQSIYPDKINKGIFISVLEALQSERILDIKYYTPLKDSWTSRKIAPIHLYYAEGCWYLTAYCYVRKAKRTFRLDRIDNCELTFDLISRDVYELTNNRDDKDSPIEVILEMDKGLYKLVKDDAFMKKSLILKESDTSYLISTKILRYEYIVVFAFRNVDRVTVISPESVINEIKNKTIEIRNKYF